MTYPRKKRWDEFTCLCHVFWGKVGLGSGKEMSFVGRNMVNYLCLSNM